MTELVPKYVLGAVLPRSDLSGYQPYQFYRIVPSDVLLMSVSLGVEAFTEKAAHQAFGQYWERADRLAEKRVQRIVQMGVPPAALMGRPYILNLVAETERRYGIPGGADIEMQIQAMQHLGVKKLALAAFWSNTVNEVIGAYFESAGIHIAGQIGWERVPAQAQTLSLTEGMKLVVDLGREALAATPEADALLMPGGTWPTAHAVPVLEREFGKPVFINMTGVIWGALRAPGILPPIHGWGRLLASTQETRDG
jgi:arylmalonate decarboxylase